MAGGDAVIADGADLPGLILEVTPTLVISAAIATRDFQDVHHDRDRARARGSQDIFLNILTTTGLVQRYVTDWAGPDALVRRVAIRLGVPCYAGDTLTFSGTAERAEQYNGAGPAGAGPAGAGAGDGPGAGGTADFLIRVTGRCRLGEHVTGTVRITVPGDPPAGPSGAAGPPGSGGAPGHAGPDRSPA
jgi:MaoC like domain